jgi:hypothetical protein
MDGEAAATEGSGLSVGIEGVAFNAPAASRRNLFRVVADFQLTGRIQALHCFLTLRRML